MSLFTLSWPHGTTLPVIIQQLVGCLHRPRITELETFFLFFMFLIIFESLVQEWGKRCALKIYSLKKYRRETELIL